MKQVLKARLDHDGAQNHLPFVYLSNKWKPGERVIITIKSLVVRSIAGRKSRGK